ncbi:MAG: DnaA N-terminal domain-containing protein [Sulfuricella sp.]
MARRREISTSFSIDDRLCELDSRAGPYALLLYTWMIPHANDQGIIPTANPREIRMLVMPGLDKVDVDTVAAALEAMRELGLLEPTKKCIAFPPEEFYKIQTKVQQKNRRSDPVEDGPPANTAANHHETPQITTKRRKSPQNASSLSSSLSFSSLPPSASALAPPPGGERACSDASEPYQAEIWEIEPEEPHDETDLDALVQRYGSGRVMRDVAPAPAMVRNAPMNGNGHRHRARDRPVDQAMLDRFERFLKAHPKPINRAEAWAAFRALAPSEELLVLMLRGLELDTASEEWRQGERWITAPAKWLSDRRWEYALRRARNGAGGAIGAASGSEGRPAQREASTGREDEAPVPEPSAEDMAGAAIAWKGILGELRCRLDEELCATWMTQLRCRAAGQGGLWLEAPTEFFRNWIAHNFAEAIGAAAAAVLHLGAAAPLHIQVNPDLEADDNSNG